MGFLVGLLLGSTLASGPGAARIQQAIAQIPLGCLYAFEQGDAQYIVCRRPSLVATLYASNVCNSDEVHAEVGPCSYVAQVGWELGALHELQAANKAPADAK